jgi:hypothetical protein
MAQGWSHGPVGAVVAAWPAASLVGSHELLVWIIRTAAGGEPVRVPDADRVGPQAGQPGSDARFAAGEEPGAGPGEGCGRIIGLIPNSADGPRPLVRAPEVDRASGPGQDAADHVDHLDHATGRVPVAAERTADSGVALDAAAVAAYQASVQAGSALSERRLAGMFGKTSRRWARNRIAETPIPA